MREDLSMVFTTTDPCSKCRGEVDCACAVCNGTGAILIDVSILVGMWQTTCQSEVASLLGLTQGRVRHRFFKAVRALTKFAEDNSKLEPYAKIFTAISDKNFNVLREVKLPQWSDRGGDECV